MQRVAVRFSSFAFLLLAACSDSVSGPEVPSPPKGDAALGLLAFEQECASCHASRDGFDLKVFGFSDTTIIRRAVAHVDTATAHNIVAYIRSLSAPRQPEDFRLFQPKGALAGSDAAFAQALFGQDAWPAGLTTAQLRAIDPRQVQIALPLPVWSDEGSNLDWMPDQPLPQAILDYAGGAAAAAIAAYRAAPTVNNLLGAVNALRNADRASANPGAPCLLHDPLRANFRECFEVRRWTSSLVAVHLLRHGLTLNLGTQIHDIWWDVGDAARLSRGNAGVPIANPLENWASWMFLGWSFDPSLHSSVYNAGSFHKLGLERHAAFISLRSLVARSWGSHFYEDLISVARFAPAAWVTNTTTFALRHLRDLLLAGNRPPAAQVGTAKVTVSTALSEALPRAPAADQPALQALAQQVLTLLDP